MKKIYFISTLFFLFNQLVAQNYGNGLGVQYTATNYYYSVHMIDAMNVVAIGDFNTLLRSYDGGHTWYTRRTIAPYTSPSDDYNAMYFVNDTVGYVTTQSDNTILKTTDGGETWNSYTSLSPANPEDIFFSDNAIGYYVTNTGYIVKTSNGGLNFNQLLSGAGTLYSIWGTSTTLWVGGSLGMLKKSTNAGVTWTTVTIGTSQSLRDIKFITDSIGWIVGSGGTVFKTINAGQTWTQLTGTSINFSRLTVVNHDTLFATAGNDSIYKSFNGGVTWLRQRVSIGQGVYEVAMDKSTRKGVAVGMSGLILTTNDFGMTWTQWISSNTTSFTCTSFINATSGWVGGGNKIMHTNDGGQTWTQQYTGTLLLNDIQFVNANNGWAVGNSGHGYKTTDGGTTWSTMTTGITSHIKGVYFTSATTGWFCGFLGRIYKTTNGGTTWIQQYGTGAESAYDLYDIHFISSTTGWACGFDNVNNAGVIVKTTNGGTTWTVILNSYTGYYLQTIFFTDLNNGWVGGNTALPGINDIFKTTNGGTTWTPYSNPTGYVVNNIKFVNTSTGFAVGRNGSLVKTTDGGLNWIGQTSGFQYDLYSISVFNPDTFWIAANPGFILNYNNCSSQLVTSVSDNSPLCSGSTLTMTAGSAGSPVYQWYGPSGFSMTGNPMVIPSIPDSLTGIYYVDAISNGCKGKFFKDTITILPGPDAPLISNADSIYFCSGTTIQLTTANQPGINFQWFQNGNPVGGNSSSYTTSQSGLYTVSASNSCGSLQSADTVNAFVNPLPSVSIAALPTICLNGGVYALTEGQPSGGIYSGTGVSGSNFDPMVSGVGTFPISYTYANPSTGCDSTSVSSITVDACMGIVQGNNVEEISINPNPANESATLSFSLDQSQQVKISLYDLSGREVKVFTEEKMVSGTHQLTINRNDLSTGVYFIKIQMGDTVNTIKLMLE